MNSHHITIIIFHYCKFYHETSFLSFQAALEYVFKLAEKERLILAIDEYPYVARSSKSLASTTYLYLFAKTGFTKGCIDAANEMGNVILVTYRDILKI